MKSPSLLSIDYDNRHFRDIKRVDRTDDFDKISFKDLVGKLHTDNVEMEITDEEMQIISEAARRRNTMAHHVVRNVWLWTL